MRLQRPCAPRLFSSFRACCSVGAEVGTGSKTETPESGDAAVAEVVSAEVVSAEVAAAEVAAASPSPYLHWSGERDSCRRVAAACSLECSLKRAREKWRHRPGALAKSRPTDKCAPPSIAAATHPREHCPPLCTCMRARKHPSPSRSLMTPRRHRHCCCRWWCLCRRCSCCCACPTARRAR
jgi:hypothetical protein